MSDDEEFVMYLEGEGELFTYSVDKNPEEIFSDEPKLVFTLIHNCHCYREFPPLKNKKLFIFVNEKGGKITYKQIFYEIDKQVKTRYDEIKNEYGIDDDLMCDHRFLEHFSKITPIQYEIWCGS